MTTDTTYQDLGSNPPGKVPSRTILRTSGLQRPSSDSESGQAPTHSDSTRSNSDGKLKIDDSLEARLQGRQLRVRRLEPWDVQHYWQEIRQLVKSMALPGVEITNTHMQYVLMQLVSGQAHCWVLGHEEQADAVLVTSVEQDTLYGFRYVHVLGFYAFASLSLPGLAKVADAIGSFAQAQGCVAIIARLEDKRVQRALSRYGAKPIPMYYKEV